jgi:Domain of unknown function (DUF6883)
MRIPLEAIIPMEKLTAYLLKPQKWHDKAKFLAQAGFTRENPHLLLAAIRELAAEAEAVEDRASEYGVFLRAEGALKGLNGRTLAVITIWLQSRTDGRTRFVTLKPRKEKKS